jgi:hypothetical protein
MTAKLAKELGVVHATTPAAAEIVFPVVTDDAFRLA